jgi:hypothetical protein
MKIYHSYWEKGYNDDIDFIVDMHTLSVHKALENYGNIHLITTEKGKELLGHLPYTSIELFEEKIPEEYKTTWAISKFYAYKQIAKKREPFLHIDYDFFLFKNLKLEDKDIIVQNVEDGPMTKSYGIDYFIKFCINKGLFYIRDEYLAYNTGIFGGKDYDSIIYYVDEALKVLFDERNKKYFIDMSKKDTYFIRTVLIEQLYLWYCLDSLNKKPYCLFEGWPSEEQARKVGICHLMGAKNNMDVRKKVKNNILKYENI